MRRLGFGREVGNWCLRLRINPLCPHGWDETRRRCHAAKVWLPCCVTATDLRPRVILAGAMACQSRFTQVNSETAPPFPRHDLKPTWYCARAWPRPRVNRWPFTPTWHSARVQENLRCQRQVSAFSNATTVRCLNLCVSGMGVGVPPGTKSLPTSQVDMQQPSTEGQWKK
jgi:hypothetical protein